MRNRETLVARVRWKRAFFCSSTSSVHHLSPKYGTCWDLAQPVLRARALLADGRRSDKHLLDGVLYRHAVRNVRGLVTGQKSQIARLCATSFE